MYNLVSIMHSLTASDMKKLSIVIPCYNEAENLPKLFAEISGSMSRSDVEVLLVNNGSTDTSATVLEGLAQHSPFIKVVTVPVNQGYGYGIIEGLKAATGMYIGWMHGDLQTPFKDVLRALEAIERAGEPTTIYLKGLRKGRPLFDQFFTLGMSVFETVLLQKKLFDVNAQPNIFHRTFFAEWKNPPHDFSLDLYALYMARTRGLTIVRIPVVFPPRQHGASHWNFGFGSKVKFIKRTVNYSLRLKRTNGFV
jgi:glycosyltransferase involved in cell wall biosynthesis